MKVQVRKSVFETNSSSMHSLVITKNDSYFTPEDVKYDFWVDSDGCVDFKAYHYGRSPFKILFSFKDKVFYALASLCFYKGDKNYKEICAAIHSLVPEFKDFDVFVRASEHSKKFYDEEYMKTYFGEGNYFSVDDYWITWEYDFGGVDENILSGFLEREGISLTEFLTNKKYIVVVDGDEYCIYKNLKKIGLINTDNIIKEYPSYKRGELHE